MKDKLFTNAVRIVFLGPFIFILNQGKPILWLALFGISLLVAIFFGRIFCGWICPMNTFMVGTEWITDRLKIKKKKSPPWLESGWLRWVVLLASVLLMVVGKRFLQKDIPVLIILLIVSVLMTLRYKAEVFHNKVCPFGILQGFTGQFAKLSRRVDSNACIGCKKCETVCPAEAILVDGPTRKAQVNAKLCHQCTNCTLVCPTKAIDYGKKITFNPTSSVHGL